MIAQQRRALHPQLHLLVAPLLREVERRDRDRGEEDEPDREQVELRQQAHAHLGGRFSIDTVSAPSGDRCRRSDCRSDFIRTPGRTARSSLGVPLDAQLLGGTQVGDHARARRASGGGARPPAQLVQRERRAVAAEVRVVPVDRVERARASPTPRSGR